MRHFYVFFLFFFGNAAAFAQVLSSSNLPILVFDMQGAPILDEPKISSDFTLFYQPNQRNSLSDSPTLVCNAAIEFRGSSSQGFPKKSYAFETRNTADSSNLNVSLAGLPAENDWNLIAAYNDKTLMRDALAYSFSAKLGNYAPKFTFCDLVVNGSYEGVYMLTESIKQGKNRVDIAKLKSTDLAGDSLTGGYIIKIDKTTGSPASSGGWESPYSPIDGKPQTTFFQFHYPKPDVLAPVQKDYIQNYVTNFENVLKSPNFADTVNGYPKYLNIPAFIDYFIINELTKNVDGYRLSTFFYKDRDSKGGKLGFGPVWDYNISQGNANYCNGEKVEGWAYKFNDYCPEDGWVVHFWWDRLMQDPNFTKALKDRWQTLRRTTLKTDSIQLAINGFATSLNEGQYRNFQRWDVLNQWVWPNNYVGGTYQNEVTYLKNWYYARLEWLDAAFEVIYSNYDARAYTPPSIYPTVFTEQLFFSCHAMRNSKARILFYDSLGRQVLKQTFLCNADGANQFVFDAPLPKGVYFANVSINLGKSTIIKLVKN